MYGKTSAVDILWSKYNCYHLLEIPDLSKNIKNEFLNLTDNIPSLT